MVAWSLRCSTCRSRKIKCDQNWPVCNQCTRGQRYCSGPPAGSKFVESSIQSCEGDQAVAGLTARGSTRDLSDGSTGKEMVTLKSQTSKHGNFQKLRLTTRTPRSLPSKQSRTDFPSNIPASLCRPIPANATLRAAAALVTAMDVNCSIGNNVSATLGRFLQYVPPMLESSPALHAAIVFCLDSLRRLRSGQLPAKDPVLYGAALQSLNEALNDPAHRLNNTTMCAVTVIQRVEQALHAHTGSSNGNVPYFNIHAGGIARLLESMGPFDPDNDFMFQMTLENSGAVASYSISRGQDCLLNQPEWRTAFRQSRNKNTIERLCFDVLEAIASLPGLIRDFHAFRRRRVTCSNLLARTSLIAEGLQNLEQPIATLLADRSRVGLSPATLPNSPVAEVYEINDGLLIRLVSQHALFTIIFNNMLLLLDHSQSQTQSHLVRSNLLVSQRIWMLCEAARSLRPLGHFFYISPLSSTVESARSDATVKWICDLANDLEGDRPGSDDFWTYDKLLFRFQALSGRVDIWTDIASTS